jgi:hypothetical protein
MEGLGARGVVMGEQLKTTSFKFSDATIAKLDKLQVRFSLIATNRTQVCRLAIDVLELVAFTSGSIDAVVRGIQGLLGVTTFPLQSEFRFPAEPSVPQGAGLDSSDEAPIRPRVVSINHRKESHHLSAYEGMAYTSPSFLGKVALAGRVA